MERESHFFIKYVSPPLHPSSCVSCPDDLNDEVVEWKERMKYFYEDFDWLLRLPDAQFWRQVSNCLLQIILPHFCEIVRFSVNFSFIFFDIVVSLRFIYNTVHLHLEFKKSMYLFQNVILFGK